MAKLRVPPFSKDDIVEIIKDAIIDGTIASETTRVDDTKTYFLKLVNGKITLVEDN